MDNEQFVAELREVKATLSIALEKLDTLIFNFNTVHQAQVDLALELNAHKAQCAKRSLRCPVLTASHPPPPPTPTPIPGGAP